MGRSVRGVRHPWVRVANVAAGWEADLMVARLAAEEIPARASGNDLTGLFGPGFMGATARGVFVEVPAPFAAAARLVLARPAAADDTDAPDAG
jgi:hypothetical protein